VETEARSALHCDALGRLVAAGRGSEKSRRAGGGFNTSPFVTCCSIELSLNSSFGSNLAGLEDLPFTRGGSEDAGLTFTPVVPQTPLPAALPLFATGIGGLGLLGRRRKRKAQAIA
jgi:hypothetical protein